MNDALEFPLVFDDFFEKTLNCGAFSRLLKYNAQGYKYYWLESILDLSLHSDKALSYDEIFNEMIYKAWYSVTYYHLRLGPTVNGKPVNLLETAVKKLNEECKALILPGVSEERIKSSIIEHSSLLKNEKNALINYVPHKLIRPFFEEEGLEEGLSYIVNDKTDKLTDYILKMPDKEKILYIFIEGEGLNQKIQISPRWRSFLVHYASVIRDWIRFNKVKYLQAKNPGVPEIIHKIDREKTSDRKLGDVLQLWKTYSEITGKKLVDIYSTKEITQLSIDHFVPRSYVAHDEMWDLVPMDRNLNSKKNNKLPSWDKYFNRFFESQYTMYEAIYPKHGVCQYPVLLDIWNGKCRKINMNSVSSDKLYTEGLTKQQFRNILTETVRTVYKSAELLGYGTWSYTNS